MCAPRWFKHFEKDAEAARVFDLAMVELAHPVAVSPLRTRDFSGVATVGDLGGDGARWCGSRSR
ncbi:hypothetical protein [Streptomyces sp. NPDC002588]|uniref:hypothetical protein n=1 Tax=Streptomyces sp. NPDC002588 TaxID=3154419 RepID=UPI0033338DE7